MQTPIDARSEPHPSAGRILVITNGNYFSAHGLHALLLWAKRHATIEVMVTTGLRKPNRNPALEAWRLFRTWGARYASYKAATYLIPLLSQMISRRPHFVAAICAELGIPVTKHRTINLSSVRERIREFAPDILISFSCPYRIGKGTLSIPRIGSLNVHSSLLPEYAGVCTYIHVLADGSPRTGVTIHEMVEEFDAGRIIEQTEIPIPDRTSVSALFLSQCRVASGLLRDSVVRILEKKAMYGVAQDLSRRTYRSEPTHEEIGALTDRGHALLRLDELFLLTATPLTADHTVPNPEVERRLRRIGYSKVPKLASSW